MGANIKLWTNNWLGIRLVDLLHIPPTLHKHLISSVADVIVDGGWNLPSEVMASPFVANHIHSMVLPTTPLSDYLVWSHSSDGKLSSKQAFVFLRLVDVLFTMDCCDLEDLHSSFPFFYSLAHYARENAHRRK